MVGHVAAFNVPGYEGCYRRLSASSVNSPNLAGALRPMARSFQQPERIAVVGVMASSGQQSQPRSRHAAGIQKARAAITDSLSLLRSSEQQEDLVGVYDEMMIDKTGRMAKVTRALGSPCMLTGQAYCAVIMTRMLIMLRSGHCITMASCVQLPTTQPSSHVHGRLHPAPVPFNILQSTIPKPVLSPATAVMLAGHQSVAGIPTCLQLRFATALDTCIVRLRPALVQIIRVPEAFVFKEGARVTDDLVAGKLLGDGVQGQVYVLKRPNGDSTDQLLKVSTDVGRAAHAQTLRPDPHCGSGAHSCPCQPLQCMPTDACGPAPPG